MAGTFFSSKRNLFQGVYPLYGGRASFFGAEVPKKELVAVTVR
jgi:hypothetical protein